MVFITTPLLLRHVCYGRWPLHRCYKSLSWTVILYLWPTILKSPLPENCFHLVGISRGVGRKPEYLGKTQLVSRDETETGSLSRQRWQASVLIFTLPGTSMWSRNFQPRLYWFPSPEGGSRLSKLDGRGSIGYPNEAVLGRNNWDCPYLY